MHLQNRTPEFCIIAPTPYLESFAAQSASHLVLAHLVDTDDRYTEFYASLDKDEHFIIMDNGAFELGESYAPEKLISLAQRCNADVIVLPDYPGCPGSKTINAAEDLIHQVKEAGFKTMFVPQSEVGNAEDWIATYAWAASHPDIDVIGMSILGIPNAIPHINRSYARVVMTSILLERDLFNKEKHHHYLGLNAGPALELPSLLSMGVMDTCDSSGPVWAGITGHRYCPNTDSFMATSKVAMHVNFDQPLTNNDDVLEDIQYNIDMTLQLFNQ
jgi:hypothetical protein